jgi:hypothetical protein
MCHELAHIVHGNHSAEFYELMEVLRGEFDNTRHSAGANGQVVAFGGAGAKADGDRHNPTSAKDARRRAVAAAEARAKGQGLMGQPGGQRLGGGASSSSSGRSGGGGGAPPKDWRALPPKVAAARAAERRWRDDQWCPSVAAAAEVTAAAVAAVASEARLGGSAGHSSGRSAGDSSSSSAGHSSSATVLREGSSSARSKFPAVHLGPVTTPTPSGAPLLKRPRVPAPAFVAPAAPAALEAPTIDLTSDDENHDDDTSAATGAAKVLPLSSSVSSDSAASSAACSRRDGCACCGLGLADAKSSAAGLAADLGEWACASCTLLNPSLALACGACALKRPQGI